MNKNRILKLLENVNEVLNNDVPTSSEYIVFVANLLRVFAIAHIIKDENLKDLNLDDSFVVESACYANPDNIGLQLMLQVHVLLKLSERFTDE
nr:MAG TPA: hypothetical protein [Caudoviricetes sp.]